MKKFISMALCLMMLLSMFAFPGFAAGEKSEIVYANANATISAATFTDTTPTNTIYLYQASGNHYNRSIFTTFDLTTLAEGDRYYVSMGCYDAASCNRLLNAEYEIDIFDVELNGTYAYRATSYANSFANDTMIKKGKVAEATQKDATTLDANGTTYAAIRVDITDYINKKLAENETSVTLFWDFDNAAGFKDGTASNLTILFADCTYGSWWGTMQLRPQIIAETIADADINTLDNITITNGVLSEEFESYKEDAFGSLTKTYTIAVPDSANDVTINYEKTSELSTVANEITTGMFGVEDELVIPVTSESGITRTYKFKLALPKDSGIPSETSVNTITATKSAFVNGGSKDAVPNAADKLWIAGSSEWHYGRMALLTFDLTDIDLTASDKFYLSLGSSNKVEASSINNMSKGTYTLQIFNTVDTSNYTSTGATYNTTVGNNSVERKEVIAEITKDNFVVDNQFYGGYLKADITDFIIEQKNKNVSTVTLLAAIDPAKGMLNASGAATTFLGFYTANHTYGIQEYRPAIHATKSNVLYDNFIEDVTVTNGILLDDFDKTKNTYSIAVIDETKPVEIAYTKSSAYSYASNEVTVADFSAGEKTLSVELTSAAETKNAYTFNLISVADSGLTFAELSIDYAFKSIFNPVDMNGRNLLSLYGRTNITDGKDVSGVSVDLYSPVFNKNTLNANEATVSYANNNGLFGFRVIPNIAKMGNTFLAVPSYDYKGLKIEGDEHIITTDAKSGAFEIKKPGYTKVNAVPTYYENTAFSIKENCVRIADGKHSFMTDSSFYINMGGWAKNANDYPYRRYTVLQFALTDDMLDAEEINLSFGGNYYIGANYQRHIDAGSKLALYSADNLNNEWTHHSTMSEMLNTGEKEIEKTLITEVTISNDNVENFVLDHADQNVVNHQSGYIITIGGENLTTYIKNCINNGQKIANLMLEITDIEKNYNENISTGLTLVIMPASLIERPDSGYPNGKNYLVRYLTQLKW